MTRFFTALGWQAITILIMALAIILLTLGYCSQREAAGKADDEAALSTGRTQSAVEAIQAIDDLGDRQQATDDEVQQAHDEIRQADPADRDAVARAALRRLQHRSDS